MIATLVRDTGTVFHREMRPLLRQPFVVLFGMMQPLVFLGLFAPLLPDDGGSALQWFVPGMIVMSCLFSSSFAGANLLLEMQTGAHERLLVTPLSRPALLIGRALKEIAPTALQIAVILVLVVPFGFDLHPAGIAVGLAILALFSVGLGALSASLALVSKGQDALFWTVQQALLYPIMLLAGVLLPLDSAPGWLRTLSKFNPMTYVVDAERELFSGNLGNADVAWGVVAAAGVAMVGLFLGVRAMRRAV